MVGQTLTSLDSIFSPQAGPKHLDLTDDCTPNQFQSAQSALENSEHSDSSIFAILSLRLSQINHPRALSDISKFTQNTKSITRKSLTQ